MTNVAVMGAGSFGTAMAKVFAEASRQEPHKVTMWCRRQEVADGINTNKLNASYLPDTVLPENLCATHDPEEALSGVGLVVLAVPSQSLRDNLASWSHMIPDDVTILNLAKGIEIGTLKRMSEVVVEVADVPEDRVAVLTGPNFAKEIATQQPTLAVVASTNEARAQHAQYLVRSDYFRPYTNNDVVGCEIGGATKNVIALVCGIASGVGLGENSRAAIITRGLAETLRLGTALGAEPLTLAGLAGVGDLVATCSSPLSRNFTFGSRLGQGMTMEQAQAAASGQVAEGVKSCISVADLARKAGVEMPLTEAVRAVCYDGIPVSRAIVDLLNRDVGEE
ncbi:NAD(P)-dependent glycerol-3-phosphate dehydrogenase [Tsukamurella sp. 8F]|uniref:NAD(P)H-dependent glycerol-3-phosphate dehydrogenase n=1 Tax=Tsukamurella sp. 8F TaxID=3031961 RepID=UPI0023B941E2|nr:NAD(P)H-dependent glycerol-3-phosphate dehydrogenase [Tsukamurella sp. 8F]MDF0586131.1 NAD(P)-dependent glycerol-3-phosphate dehydrogenase [Tsukamurella sp. 8F]